MRGNFDFRDEDSARNFHEREGGTFHDNRHSCPEWGDKQFTVKIDASNEAPQGPPEDTDW